MTETDDQVPVEAPEQSAAIHPGVLTTTTGGGQCTSNFVFTAGGRSYLGQAAHCSATGKATDDEKLEAEGKGDQAKSDLKQAGENIKDAFKN